VVAVTVLGLTGCGGASEDQEQAAPATSLSSTAAGPSSASPAATAAAGSPLGAGELIVFDQLLAGEESRDLYAVDPSGGEPTLVRPGEYPHWSPDGSQLSFLDCLNPPDCTTGVALMERSTGKVHWFPMPDPDLFTGCALWAPSGETLACDGESESDPSRNGVYTVRVSDGQGLTRVTSNPGGVDSPVTYSPDGRLLLFSRTPADAGEGSAKTALFVTPARGGKATRITPLGYTDDAASWSPDGQSIVFETFGSLFRVRPDGTGMRKIAVTTTDGTPLEHTFDVDYSPDGSNIVFSVAGAEPGLYLAHPDGSGAERLTTSPTEDHHANWGVASGA
jgi:Tol biopolymer transport system component